MAELALGYCTRLDANANQNVSQNFRIPGARLPQLQQFRMRKAAQWAKERVVKNDTLVVKIHQHRIMTGRRAWVHAVVQNCANIPFLAEA